ncbi:Lrp/AsnC family transcriptional regulator [Galbibacter pacificus]|uniref:Lrp/AsnC family transcriptional regulator n=1 Tax=Galbibacter pacificus TaxID=2996052 RepID=A0ABT6FPS0_9FLAO|nr:Lrp/AsnC family transcriptional regulator [Galbibacter pacificus]MDG3582257.1 Lrp/AsnC family transcriptional regulator [Galbibacter pacificus]MDG3585267.1 Lrp/AsnC family transcriptional regulator [Galbibacter pacificus]
MKLDTIDKKLLELLQNDAKQTTKVLSLQLNLSKTAVYERIRKLEKEGVIKGYTALLDKKKIDKAFVVFCHVRLTQHTKEHVVGFESDVIRLEEVLECYHVSGDYDYILKVNVADMQAYRNFMTSKLTSLKHIGSTHSIFMIEEVKNTTVVEL